MDIDKFSNGTIKNKTLEEWLYEKDDFDLQSFLEEDTEDAVIEEQKKNEPEQETKFDYCSHWGDTPILSIPQSIVLIGLDMLAEKLRIASKLAERHKWKQQTIEKWIHAINWILALVIAYGVLLAILVVLVVIGVDISKLVENR